jgi:hypothetical protein
MTSGMYRTGLVWLLTLAAVHTSLAVSGEDRFRWNEANARLANARAPAQYREAAALFAKMVDSGIRNGPLFYNLGTALLKAGEYDAAESSLLRAERYMGADPAIERNLLLAAGRGKPDPRAGMQWYRPLLFWHYEIPGPTRVAIAVSAFAVCWLALILRLVGAKIMGRHLLVIGILALCIFGTSAVASMMQEHHDNAVFQAAVGKVAQAAPGGRK